MARPRLRMRLGRHLIGEPPWRSMPHGVAVYKEWDPADRKFYHWEEWELLGYENLDFWVAYDHYSREVSLYWPATSEPQLDPTQLRQDQRVVAAVDGHQRTWRVVEAGAGTIDHLEGGFTYDITHGQQVAYAELREVGGPHRVVVERFDDRVLDTYAARTLDLTAQKQHFGRRIAPRSWRGLLTALAVLVFVLVSAVTCGGPGRATDCTPRAGQTVDDCRTGYGGGGGGIGK
ncbi:hypothetical protein [Desertihabitans aurantiacus]|uniref:hypothetical protein n=1 Tax=Desertihabitans aurantiacus TaxID=2282477 RepID=UPI0013001D89|nr:hypothetical protein [Desertihabitans aurantiacus]